MTDPAFTLLTDALNADSRAAIVWVVDENVSAAQLQQVLPKATLLAITNRIDIGDILKARGFRVQLSDFCFAGIADQSCNAIYFRVAKEKAIVHYIINSAGRYLQPGGELILAGCKNDGIKTYIDKAAGYLGGAVAKRRGDKTAQLVTIGCTAQHGAPLDDKNYRQWIELETDIGDGAIVSLVSKPGVYGWNKIDKGSAFLVSLLPETLPDILRRLPAMPVRVADLGCGFGYLAVMANKLMASQQLKAHFVATDNNIAAVDLCRENFSRHGVEGEVVLADCGGGIARQFDLVLCNPPFHQGFSVEGALTEKFLRAARRLLKAEGSALFVVNSFIPLERKASREFSTVKTLGNNGSFKVLLLQP